MQNLRFTDGTGIYAAVETSSIGKKKIIELFGPIENGLLKEDTIPIATNTRTVMYVSAPDRNVAMNIATSGLTADNDNSVTRTNNDTIEVTVDKEEKKTNQYKISIGSTEEYCAEVATTAPSKETAVANVMKNPTSLEYSLKNANIFLNYIRSCNTEQINFSEAAIQDMDISDEEKVPDTYTDDSQGNSSQTFSVGSVTGVVQNGGSSPWNVKVTKTVTKDYEMIVDAENAIEAQNLAIEKIQGDYENGNISITYNSYVSDGCELEEVHDGEESNEDVFQNKKPEKQPETTDDNKEDEDELGSLDDDEDLNSIISDDEDDDEDNSDGVEVVDPFKS